jgi:hypothetical protein
MTQTSIGESARPKIRWLPTPSVLIGVWLVFFVIVLVQLSVPSIVGFQPDRVQFAGAFGDAFGVLSSLMATIAALGAWETVRQQRNEASERARESQKTVFNEKFFSLLSHLNGLVDGTDIDVRKNNERVVREGRDAFRSMLTTLRKKIPPGLEPISLAKIQKRYLDFYHEKENDLGHYFRTIYVICKMIVDEQDHIDKNSYFRILRSQLSNSEMLFLLYNCSVGYGGKKFLPIINDYSLFQNLRFSNTGSVWEEALLKPLYDPRAFASDTGDDEPIDYGGLSSRE